MEHPNNKATLRGNSLLSSTTSQNENDSKRYYQITLARFFALFFITTFLCIIMASAKVSIMMNNKDHHYHHLYHHHYLTAYGFAGGDKRSSPSSRMMSSVPSSSSSSCPLTSFFVGRGGFGGFYLLPIPSKNNSNNTRIAAVAAAATTTTTISTAHHQQQPYNWKLSTEENYRSSNGGEHPIFVGEYKEIRQQLDQKYHATYTHSRQMFQDTIIKSMLLSSAGTSTTTQQDQQQQQPWIIFTAGVMGAGKSYTIRQLHQSNQFPLEQEFVTVDPDEIRRQLPEFDTYASYNQETAGKLTRKEAGMISEILTLAALRSGHNVLVDGSLRDYSWYSKYFQFLREVFPKLKLGIIHVTAPTKDIFERVKKRAKLTGRLVPKDVLLESIDQVPKSVEILKEQVDYFLEIHNDSGSSDDDKKNSPNAVSIVQISSSDDYEIKNKDPSSSSWTMSGRRRREELSLVPDFEQRCASSA